MIADDLNKGIPPELSFTQFEDIWVAVEIYLDSPENAFLRTKYDFEKVTSSYKKLEEYMGKRI